MSMWSLSVHLEPRISQNDVECFKFYFLDFTYEFIQRGGLRDPLIFEKPDGLGIK